MKPFVPSDSFKPLLSFRMRAAGMFFLGITIIWGVAFYLIQNAKQSSVGAAMDRSRLISQRLAEQARATVRLIDLAASQIADDWSTDPVQFARDVKRTENKISDITAQVGVVNREGMLVYSDLGLPSTSLNLQDREHVRAQLESKDDKLFISRPLIGRHSKKWSIEFTRVISRGGLNVGVVVLSVDPGYFVRHFETFNVGERGIISLFRDTGEMMARGPVLGNHLGRVFKDHAFFSTNAPKEGNFHQHSPADGVPRFYGYTRIAEFGLIAVAGVAEADALHNYLTQRNWIICSAALLSFALMLLIITIIRPLEGRARLALDHARSSEESFQLLVNGVTDYAIIKLDQKGFVSHWNIGAQRIKGYSADEIVGSHYSCFFTPRDISKGLPVEGLRIAAESGRFEDTGYRLGKSGLQFWANEVITALRTPEGQPVGFAVVTRDITERRKAEQEIARVDEQLREAQKLEGIGQLTGGLAHDFNNLLGIVVGNLDLIGEHLPDNERLRRQHKTALDAALRGAEVTRSLLAVARRQPLEVKEYDIHELIREMLPLLRSSAGSAVTIDLDFSSGELRAMLDSGGFSQVVLNLVNNSRDAMESIKRDKKLTIRTSEIHVRSNEIPQLTPGKYAVLEVTDTGSGMSESIRQQAFEPFFTTKERGRGTGLGLSMVYGYATQLGGSASIASTSENGTTVRLFLPMLASEVIDNRQGSRTQNLQLEHADACSISHIRILIVDDEVSLCDLAGAWISSLGYGCSVAQSPQVALRLLDEQPYDLLFTDIVMPGPMDGVALALEALKRQPQLRVLFASGYSPLLKNGDLPGPILNKPYRKQQLHRALAALLETAKAHEDRS